MTAALARGRDVFAAEWTKIYSVRTTYWLLGVAALTAIGGSGLVALSARVGKKAPKFDPSALVFVGWLEYPVLALGIFGALNLTSEYSSGQIRTTLTAVPQRLTVLAAKAGVTGAVALVAGEVFAFASYLLGAAILTGHHGGPRLTSDALPGAPLAAGVALAAIALTGVGLGTVIRSTAGAVAALPAILYLPLIALTLPHPWNDDVGRFTLLTAAYQLVSSHPHPGLLAPPLSLLVILAWPAAALLAGAVLLRSRDA